MNKDIYLFMESNASWLCWWVLAFTFINLFKIYRRFSTGDEAKVQNTFFVEAAGIPLVLLHSVCFMKAVLTLDLLSMLLFAWWGPGFLIVATLYIVKMKQGAHLKWGKTRNLIAWVCKLNYLVFALVYWKLGSLNILFVFSIWIINDQIMMLWLSDDADRTRRCFHDFWFIRILYPLGLLIPIIYPEQFPNPEVWMCYGLFLLGIWCVGLMRLVMNKRFMSLPKDQGLLRNMTYFQDEEVQDDRCY
ncbi:MAG: hypothetical protein NE328_13315 [Lentisphaeraceae bacterium]|nr:hypothetical protein [Lentisphaeraceae bacterium]